MLILFSNNRLAFIVLAKLHFDCFSPLKTRFGKMGFAVPLNYCAIQHRSEKNPAFDKDTFFSVCLNVTTVLNELIYHWF